MLPDWLNIYRNSKCLRFYCVEVVNTTTLVKTKSQRSSVDKWKTQFYYFILFLKTIHFAYLFAARSKLDDHLRLLHFDSPFLLRTTPTLNFLLFVMSILTLVCLYQLYWFDLTRSLASNPRVKLLRLVEQVNNVLFSQTKQKTQAPKLSKKSFPTLVIFKADPLSERTVDRRVFARLKMLNFFLDSYVSAFISMLT